jgi:hypothetical protein
MQYALDSLNAIGIIVNTNHESLYLGNAVFTPFFAALRNRAEDRKIVFIHPKDPHTFVDGALVVDNPSTFLPKLSKKTPRRREKKS